MDARVQMDIRVHTVLCVGDEVEMLTALDQLFQQENFRFLTSSDPMEAIRLLRQNDIHLVISGQRLPGGGENLFLKRVACEFPDTLRSVLTGYSQADIAGRLIQQGRIDAFFLRPWYDEQLKWEIRRVLEHYELIQENKRLLKSNHLLETRLVAAFCGSRAETGATLSEDILDQLPLPVIGIGGNQKIILANRAARQLPPGGDPLSPGRRICEFFPDAIAGPITVALHTRTIRIWNRRTLWGDLYDLTCISLDTKNGDGDATGFVLLHRIK